MLDYAPCKHGDALAHEHAGLDPDAVHVVDVVRTGVAPDVGHEVRVGVTCTRVEERVARVSARRVEK